MKNTLRLEEGLMLILAVYLNTLLPFAWWWYWVFFLTPDIGMVGYLFNARAGAILYNLFHHKGIAVGFYLVGIFLSDQHLMFVGLLFFGHSSFDRVFGYGLKYPDSFHNTHLGWIGEISSTKNH
jgi:hypothetical protein